MTVRYAYYFLYLKLHHLGATFNDVNGVYIIQGILSVYLLLTLLYQY